MKLRSLIVLLLLAASLSASLPVSLRADEAPKDPPKEPGKEVPKETPKEAPKDAAKDAKDDKKEAKKEPEKPKTIDETVKDYEKLPGLFTIYRKLDGNKQKLMLELTEDQLNQTFLLQMTFGSGFPGSANSGTPIQDVVLRFQKSPDDRLLLVSPDVSYRVDKNSPQAAAVAREFPDTVVEVFGVAAKQTERKSMLIDVSDFFRNGLAGAGKVFELSDAGLGSIDSGKSYIESLKSLPENLILQMTYNAAGRTISFGGLSLGGGAKSKPVKVDYNLFRLPETGYTPRLADPRVGYFVNGLLSQNRVGFNSFDNDSNRDPRVVYINRWRLEKADPNAALSAPKKPIVFWIDRAFPTQYRVAATQGIELWNRAFERIGFKDAIVVKQMPDNADWDHADLRYNVLRWVTTMPSADSASAVALMRENPMTGEILGANINVNANWMRVGRAELKDTVNPWLNPKAQSTAQDASQANAQSIGQDEHKHDSLNPAMCSYGEGLSEQAWFGWQALELQMAMAPRMKVDENDYANALLRAVVAHEMGHILGLRHNFIASTLHDGAELANAKTVAATGVSASLMDYTGFNVYALKTPGVELFSSTAGPYDMWAIEYGYKPIGAATPEDEQPALRAIAARCNEPGLAYQSDELADGYDPSIARYDLGKDPIASIERSFQLNRELMATLGERLPKRGEDYSEFTRALARLTTGNANRANQAVRYIGGLNVRRNNRGDREEKPLVQPVSATEQRRALKLINDNVFSANAFNIPADYFKKMAPDPYRFGDVRASNGFPVRDEIGNVQDAVLANLFSPVRLSRMENTEYKTPQKDELTLLELFRSVQSTIWSELDTKANIGPLHRDLQRTHLDMLISFVNGRVGNSDTKMLAWDTLRRLKGQIALARKGNLDAYSRLHLDESQMRIERALNAQAVAGA